MEINYVNANGSVKISEDVIATIVGVTARENENIAGITVRTLPDIKGLIPGKKTTVKGIRVEIEDEQIVVEVGVVVRFGSKLQETALKLQEDIVKEIEAMTGMQVRAVHVYIQGMGEKSAAKAPLIVIPVEAEEAIETEEKE